jgi:hypothetical protein
LRDKKQGGKKNRKYGRNLVKCAAYKSRHLREIHKYYRVLQSCGRKAAKQYAKDNHIEDRVK